MLKLFEVSSLSRGQSLADQVYEELSRAILAGSFAPGERVTIRRLADDIDVSVTPVREAVLRLVADGVLEATEKSAIKVPERNPIEIQEIFEIRAFLEGEMAEKAAPNLTDEDVAALHELQSRLLAALDREDFVAVLRCNSEFHFRIYSKAEMPVRLKLTESLWLRIGPTLRRMYPKLKADRANHKNHERIIASAAMRDGKALRFSILEDLLSSQTAIAAFAIEREQQQLLRRPRALV